MRNPVFDIMKGIGIILVLIGHIPISAFGMIGTVDTSIVFSVIKRIIYSFHMPLFFLLSGYLVKVNAEENGGMLQFFRKKFIRLIFPYLASFLLLIIWSCIRAIFKNNWLMPCRHLLSMIWGSQEYIGQNIFCLCFGGAYISHTWFLWALLWGLVAFYVIKKTWKKRYLWISIGISILACLCYKFTKVWCPWCIMEGLGGALPFIAIGHWIKEHTIPQWFWMLSIFAMILSCFFFPSPLNLSSNGYTFYPINLLGGIGGTYCIYWLAFGINKLKYSRQLWKTIGTISLPILCFHEIEPLTDIFNSVRLRLIQYFVIPDIWCFLIRYMCVISIAYFCTRIPYLKKIYLK